VPPIKSKLGSRRIHMSLLREIQNSAIDSKTELSTLLRKCKVLAARLGNPEFKMWVEQELSGYPNQSNLPEYRVIIVNSKGHFSGPFQSGLRNANIPMLCIPEEFRDMLSHVYLTQPMAALESLVAESENNTIHEPWNPDIVAHFGMKIYQGMNCMQAWKVIPTNAIVATVDAVRNRILNFVLEIESESPDAGEAAMNSNPVDQEKVSQIFNTYITGDIQNFATGNTNATQTVTINKGAEALFNDLLSAIQSLDEKAENLDELTDSVKQMQANQENNNFKTHYLNFMSILSNHMTVFCPVVAPFLPQIAKLLA
jgi:hypothetical protein